MIFLSQDPGRHALHAVDPEIAALSDAELRETAAQPVRLFQRDSVTRRLNHSFRILGRYRTMRHYQLVSAGVVLLGLAIEPLGPDPLPFTIARLLVVVALVLGACGFYRPRSIPVEGMLLGGPLLLMLLLAGLIPLIYAPALFTQEFEIAYLGVLTALSLLQLDVLMLFALAALVALISLGLVSAAPLAPRIKADLLLSDLCSLAAICNFRRLAMVYRCRNILVSFMVELQTRALKDLTAQLKVSAATDQLTGAFNRRYLEDVSLALPTETQLGILLIDIDRFKLLNDTCGHTEGDRCLRLVSDAISATLREADTLVRYGGEEFIVMFEAAQPTAALQLAERIRARVAADVRTPLGAVTVSIGVATGPAHLFNNLVEAADRAMYRAKAAGRNRVCAVTDRVILAAG